MKSKIKESEELKYRNIRELFSLDSYVIPIYQRNYAWGESEITQLIQDIVDSFLKDANYYIGTLIVWKKVKKNPFETIDGQQRLTTLSILLSVIKKEYPNVDLSWYTDLKLEFRSRTNSKTTLEDLFNKKSPSDKDCDIAIKEGYEIAKRSLRRIFAEKNADLSKSKFTIKNFCSYFFEQVKILRVRVPNDTDLNQYFEIMNSRGKQLEKHEILKAKMIQILDKRYWYAFKRIWEACSNMDKYVQDGFTEDQRGNIFGKKLDVLSDISKVYGSLGSGTYKKQSPYSSIEDLLRPHAKQIKNPEDELDDADNYEKFKAIIDFPNFLLQILKIQIKKEDISLDDKLLIETFEGILDEDNNDDKKKSKEFVKKFGYNLLKGKFLFDKYIIKGESLEDGWSLKKIKYNDGETMYISTFRKKESNGEILMLLSMFHVSMPNLVYKHWMNAALKYVFENSEQGEISDHSYKEYLEGLARAFLYDRFLAKEPKSYFDIIYTNNGISKNTDNNIDKSKLDQGTEVDDFIFNYLDYLLWQDYRKGKKVYFKDTFNGVKETKIDDDKISYFRYTFRNSVEHYYPQEPNNDNNSIALTEYEIEQGKTDWLNNFGNLCLISGSRNSSFSNYMPIEKKAIFKNNKAPTIESIKQRIMIEYEKWEINQIEEHGKKMKELLLKYI